MMPLLFLLLLLHPYFCGNIVYINNWDDVVVIGGNITQNILTPTSSEMLRALASTNEKTKIAMGQTYGGLNAQLAWNWFLSQYPPFQTPLSYESALFFINGSTAETLNIVLWQLALVMNNYVQPGCESGAVPLWTEQNIVECRPLLDVDVRSQTASNIITYLISISVAATLLGCLYFLGGMFYKSVPRKIKDN